MNVLKEIIKTKRKEVDERKNLFPIKLLEKSIYFNTKIVSMKEYLQREGASGIIAEFKRRSPSKGDINIYADIEEVTRGYMQAGASVLSVLTDEWFFGGENGDLTKVRKFNFCPVLRKDFIIDEYQIFEAKSIGADAILLIAEALDKDEINKLVSRAKLLGLEVLMEFHSPDQLNKLNDNVDIIGINNRNLKTFEVSIENSKAISKYLPDDFIRISESGINNPEDIVELRNFGFSGFLIGERFMKTPNPARACKSFIDELNNIN
jgi:indole-3-glycerol phosphate synthase